MTGISRTVAALVAAAVALVTSSTQASAYISDPTVGGRAVTKVTRTTYTWQVPEPKMFYTASGALTPSLATIGSNVPRPYADSCHVPSGDTTVRTLTTYPTCLTYGSSTSRFRVALVGDSKMVQWFPGMDTIAKREGWRLSVHTKSSCAFTAYGTRPECQDYDDQLFRYLVTYEKPKIVVMSTVESGDRVGRGIAARARALQRAGIQVVFVDDTPAPVGTSVLSCLRAGVSLYTDCNYPYADGRGSPAVKEAYSLTPGAKYFSMDTYVCPTRDSCPAAMGGVFVFRNGSHLSNRFADSLTDVLHVRLYRAGVATVRPPAYS